MSITLRPLLVGVTILTLIALPGAATASAPAAVSPSAQPTALGERVETKVRFLDFHHQRNYGTTTVVRGQITANLGNGVGSVPNARVELLRKYDGSSAWKSVGHTSTDTGSHPKFRFELPTKASASYRVVYDGNDTYRPTKATTSVGAYRVIESKIKRTSGLFIGHILPRQKHVRVFLEKAHSGDGPWRRVDSKRTLAKGKFTFKVGAPKHGKWWWVISTDADTSFLKSHGSIWTTRRG